MTTAVTRTPAPEAVVAPPRPLAAGLALALVSAATFGTAGPAAKALLVTGWTPGSVVFLRVLGGALILLVPTVRAMRGRWHLLRCSWREVLVYGALAVAGAQLFFFYAVQHVSVGVALMLEYLGMVLVVGWQWLRTRVAPGPLTGLGIVLALCGLMLVLDVFGAVHLDVVGVLCGLGAATGLATYFVLSGEDDEESLPPLALAGAGLLVGAVGFAVAGAVGVLPMEFHTAPVRLAGFSAPFWVALLDLTALAAATAYATGVAATRALGARVASFVGLFEVLFAVLFAWLLLGELPRPVQLLGGLLILGGVVAVRMEGERGPVADFDADPVPAETSAQDEEWFSSGRPGGASYDG